MTVIRKRETPAPAGSMKITPVDLLGPMNDHEKLNAPPWFYAGGDLDLCRCYAKVSVIGTRDPTHVGLRRTVKLVTALVERGVVVVSGLAAGVDTCAHTTAIELGGKTIAVLGTPLDREYPKENADLQRRIMADHLVLSRYPAGAPIQSKNFPLRNRDMALISDVTVIVEAGAWSGTIHQGWEALRLGRPLFILESMFGRQDIRWPRAMRASGARILSDGTIVELFELLSQKATRWPPETLAVRPARVGY